MTQRLHRISMITFFMSALLPSAVWAGDQIGTLTQLEGDITLFSNPSKTLHKEGSDKPRALFEGEYYLFEKPKVGDRVQLGNIVRTALGSKVRVVFDNGDQFNVGPGTAYRVFWDKDSAKGQTEVKLMYGKLRGVIEKGGPRSQLKVRTRSATMGVRGTDFFIAENPKDGETEISVIRGSVEVKAEAPKGTPEAEEPKAQEIPSGFSATIVAQPEVMTPAKTTTAQAADGAKAAPIAPLVVPVIEIRKTTQEDLSGIKKSSELAKAPEAPVTQSKELTQKLEKLESKAVETTLKDIKKYDPKLFAKLETQTVKNTNELNASAVETLIKEAPKAPKKRKPFKSELDDLENGAYEKYFKIIE